MPTNDRKYMREYMRRKRAEGKIKHWRQYKLEKEAREIADNLFNKGTLDKRIPSYEIELNKIESSSFSILDAIEKLHLTQSRSDTKRLIKSKGIKVNDKIFSSSELSLKSFSKMSEIKISVGKKNFGILRIK